MMIKWLWIAAVALMVSGCADKNSYVKVVDDSIKGDIVVEKIDTRISESGLMELQVMGDNKTQEYMKLRYRVVWFDKDGFEIKSLSQNWTELPVYKNANFTINAVAPSPKAADYRLFINK